MWCLSFTYSQPGWLLIFTNNNHHSICLIWCICRYSKTFLKQRQNFQESYRASWAHTYALFIPQRGRNIGTLISCNKTCIVFIKCINIIISYNEPHLKMLKLCVFDEWMIFRMNINAFENDVQLIISMLYTPLSAPFFRISSADISHILGNLEEISTFQQMLVQSLEEHTKFVCQSLFVHKVCPNT